MKLYLDTHIIIFLLENSKELIRRDIYDEIVDYSNALFTSTACVQEMIYLRHRGKILVDKPKTKGKSKSAKKQVDIVDMIDELGIKILPVTKKHLKKLEAIPLIGEHRDHNDRVIIAQAISDKATLVSSDSEFRLYEEYGLDLLYNER